MASAVNTYRGLSFPFRKSAAGTPAPALDDTVLSDSLVQIVLTARGERVMRPAFGTRTLAAVFERQNQELSQTLIADIQEAIVQNEPRVLLLRVNATPEYDGSSRILSGVLVEIAFRSKLTGANGLIKLPIVLDWPAMTTRALFAGSDFDSHFDELTARIQAKFAAAFNDFSLSSLGIVLVDLVAYGADSLSYAVDRRTTESYLATARTRRAMARLTRQLGYKMGAATAASIDLQVSLTQTYAFDVPILKGFQFQGPNESVYEVAQDAVILAGNLGPVTVSCYQGTTLSETFTASGLPNQVYPLKKLQSTEFVVQGYAVVTVDATPYTELRFLDIVTTPHYEIGYNDDPPTLRFGDGVAGSIPPSGATITITYVASKGKTGQATKDSTFDVVSPLVANFQNIPITIANPDGSIGGDDPESLEHARAFAPKVWRSLQVAVTEGDYDALAGSYTDPLFGHVAVAKAVAARSAANDLELTSLLAQIRADILPVETSVIRGLDGAVGYTGLLENLDAIDAAAAGATAEVSAGATENDALLVDVQGAINTTRQVKNVGVELGADAAQITTLATALTAQVTAIATGGADQLLAGTKTALLDALASVSGTAGQVASGASSVTTSASTGLALLDEAVDRINAQGVNPLVVSLTSAQRLGRVQAWLDSITTVSTPGARTNATDIRAAVQDLGAEVDALCTQVFDHVDHILAQDCQANLVIVPILARDGAGFYAAPSVGLVQSLQAMLDARKEVTQTVRVISGASSLVRASVRVRLGVVPGKALNIAAGTAEAAINAVLRDRAFGASLYQSALWTVAKQVSGASFANVEILGYLGTDDALLTDKLDADGNLIIAGTEVVTRGAVVVTTEVVG